MGWLSSAVKSVGSVLNDLTGVSDSTNQQRKMMEAQNAYNTQMWNAQNEYNSPTAQLARMREAGIDINPIAYALGSGNLSNTASSVSSGSGFVGSPAGNPISMLMGMAQGIQGVRESKQRVENMKEQGINIMTEGNNLLTRGTQMKLVNDIMRHNLRYAENHNLPVNAVPGLESSTASLVNEIVEKIRKSGNF